MILRALDLLGASAGLAVGWPLLLASSVISAVGVGFPPWYASRRVGQGGREYLHVKIKTMRPGRSVGRVFFEQHRINTVGRMLRRYHLDELPELVHILRGQMSLVGPRPLPRELLAGLDTTVRESVRPGWTGPAQLHLLRHGKLDKHTQLALDNAYVAERCLALNLRILAQTLAAALYAKPLDLRPDATAARRRFGEGNQK
ncbi:MAG: sugar transferase [Myxococcota bacterium]|jgi:lipopolysaccharide/colanic/teichoic acid biosynthesis glycosyltransferase|nr:sugar transferase [Myxococcota bacterium]